jgi:hypothetical protein
MVRSARRLLAVTALMSSLVGAAACGGDSAESTDASTDGAAAPETGVDATTDGSMGDAAPEAHDGAAEGSPDGAADASADTADEVGDAGAATDAPSDAHDAAAEGSSDGSADAGADAVDEAGSEAGDAAADTVSDALTDAASEAGVPAEGGADGGLTSSFPGELAPPYYTSSNCTLWGSSPPLLSFGTTALAVGSEGLWAGSASSLFVMRLSGGVWYLSTLPGLANGTGVSRMVAGTGWAAAVTTGNGLYYHASGQPWVPINVPFVMAGTELYAADTELVAFSASGVYWFDGTAWNTIAYETGSAGAGAAAGPHDNLYMTDNLGWHHYDGMTWTDVGAPSLPASSSLGGLALSASGQLVASAGGSTPALFVLSGGTWTNVTPLPCSMAGRMMRSGPASSDILFACADVPKVVQFVPGTNTFVTRASTTSYFVTAVALSGSTLYLLEQGSLPTPTYLMSSTGGTATFVVTSAAPSYRSGGVPNMPPPQPVAAPPFAGRSATDLYAAQDEGIMALSGGAWSQLPGTGSMAVEGMWESPDGTLFFAEKTSNGLSMHRWTAGKVTTDATLSGNYWSNLTGRSASDAYFGVDDGVQHWSGTSWTNTGFPDPGSPIRTLGVGNTPDLFVNAGPRTYLWDGSASHALPSSGLLCPGSSGATPLVFQWTPTLSSTTVQYDQGPGWTSIATPVPNACTSCAPTGPDPSHVVIFDNGTFTYWNGTTWSTYTDLLTQLISTTSVAWTDGTNAAVAAPNGVVLCALP